MHKYLILLLAFIVVSCGNDNETVIKTDDGEVRISSGDEAVEDLPMGLKLYPGAEVQSSISGSGEGKSGVMIVFKTSDDQSDVIDFYKKQMKSSDIEVQAEVNAGDMKMIGGEGINVSAVKDGEGSVTVTLIAGNEN